MSVLVIAKGEDIFIKALLSTLGCNRIIEWRERNIEEGENFPKKVESVLIHGMEIKRELVEKCREKAAERSIPFIYTRSNPSLVYQEWIKQYKNEFYI